MKQVIQPSAQQHFPTGKTHDLSDACAIDRVIAMAWAVFAGGLGIHRAMGPFGEGVNQQFVAFRAKSDAFAGNCIHIVGLEIDLGTLLIAVSIAAIERDEQRERSEVFAKFGIEVPYPAVEHLPYRGGCGPRFVACALGGLMLRRKLLFNLAPLVLLLLAAGAVAVWLLQHILESLDQAKAPNR